MFPANQLCDRVKWAFSVFVSYRNIMSREHKFAVIAFVVFSCLMASSSGKKSGISYPHAVIVGTHYEVGVKIVSCSPFFE